MGVCVWGCQGACWGHLCRVLWPPDPATSSPPPPPPNMWYYAMLLHWYTTQRKSEVSGTLGIPGK